MQRSRVARHPRQVTRSLLVVLLAAVPAVLLSGCGLHHSPGWKRADLDRNRLDLGLYRGADTGEELATWATQGEVVAALGSSERQEGGDLQVVVRYRLGSGRSWLGERGERVECWRFTTPDGYGVEFSRIACP